MNDFQTMRALLIICYCVSIFCKDLFVTEDQEEAYRWLSERYEQLQGDGYRLNFPKRHSLEGDILAPLSVEEAGEIRMVKEGHFSSTICDLGFKIQKTDPPG